MLSKVKAFGIMAHMAKTEEDKSSDKFAYTYFYILHMCWRNMCMRSGCTKWLGEESCYRFYCGAELKSHPFIMKLTENYTGRIFAISIADPNPTFTVSVPNHCVQLTFFQSNI